MTGLLARWQLGRRSKDSYRRVMGKDGGYRGERGRDGGYRGERFRRERFDRPDVKQWDRQENWGRKAWKEAGESAVPKMVGQGVYGVGAVLAALMAGRREFYALYTQVCMDLSGSNKKKDKKAVEKVLQMAEKVGLKVIETSKHDLNMMVDNRPHQGLVLDASPLEMVNTKELDPVRVEDGRKAPVWLALDEVMDPQNLGAIIRSAYYFSAEGVVLCAKNSAPLSGVVSKASAGSLELIELLSC
jgi:21S rRNA (GM2251-2'-O)-methyltransferase